MANTINQSTFISSMNWAYEKAVNGVPGLDSAQELASDYLKGNDTLENKINSLIRWQNTKCATSGFISGLGGTLTLPIAVPANIACVIYVQIRMIAAIAYMSGYDIKDDRVKTLVFVCLTGNAANDFLKEIGINIGKKLTEQAIKSISKEVIVKINQAVGFRLVTKFGEKGLLNLCKAIPLFSALIGATLDCVATNTIGNASRNTFARPTAKA